MFYAAPSLQGAHVVFVYKNFRAVSSKTSHDGLGISSLLTAKVLRGQNVRADLEGITAAAEIPGVLAKYPTCTHLVIQAPWIAVADLAPILQVHPNVHFVVLAHSQVAFLQADPGAITNLTALLRYQESVLNLSVAVNNPRIRKFLASSYGARVLLLPNLYPVTNSVAPPWHSPHDKPTIRVGSFGATRPLKNHTTAGAAALMLANVLGSDLEFHVSGLRTDGGPEVIPALQQMFAPVVRARLVIDAWCSWPTFRKIAESMDLGIQASFTESFNITTADMADACVPSVVSEAIDWAPDAWKTQADDPEAIARTGLYLLSDRNSGSDGKAALTAHVASASKLWTDYLGSNPT